MQHINMTYLSKCCKSSHHFEYAPYFTTKFEIMAEPAEFMTMDYLLDPCFGVRKLRRSGLRVLL